MNMPRWIARYVLILVCFCAGPVGVSANEARNHHYRAGTALYVQPDKGLARLHIRRIPNLGTRVIVSISIDGVPIGPIGYGHAYNGLIAPGRHVVSLLPTPSPLWSTPSQTILDVQNGEDCQVTVMSNHSGHLIMVRGIPTPNVNGAW